MKNQLRFVCIIVAATLLSGCLEVPYHSSEFGIEGGDYMGGYGFYPGFDYIDGEDFFPGFDYGLYSRGRYHHYHGGGGHGDGHGGAHGGGHGGGRHR
jgi:hypothetical protein